MPCTVGRRAHNSPSSPICSFSGASSCSSSSCVYRPGTSPLASRLLTHSSTPLSAKWWSSMYSSASSPATPAVAIAVFRSAKNDLTPYPRPTSGVQKWTPCMCAISVAAERRPTPCGPTRSPQPPTDVTILSSVAMTSSASGNSSRLRSRSSRSNTVRPRCTRARKSFRDMRARPAPTCSAAAAPADLPPPAAAPSADAAPAGPDDRALSSDANTLSRVSSAWPHWLRSAAETSPSKRERASASTSRSRYTRQASYPTASSMLSDDTLYRISPRTQADRSRGVNR